MHRNHANIIEADPSWRIGIVYSSFYEDEIKELRASARLTLEQSGINPAHITEHDAAGAFEIPLIGSALAESRKVDALIGLGIIVEGETHHAELLARESARGMMDVQMRFRLPFAFEVLYVDSITDARERFAKGEEAARAALHSLAQLRAIQS